MIVTPNGLCSWLSIYITFVFEWLDYLLGMRCIENMTIESNNLEE